MRPTLFSKNLFIIIIYLCYYLHYFYTLALLSIGEIIQFFPIYAYVLQFPLQIHVGRDQ